MMFFFYKHMLNDGDLVTVIRLLEERYSLQEVAKRLTMSVNHCTIGSVHRRFRGTGLHIRKPGQSRPWSADERDDRLIRSGERFYVRSQGVGHIKQPEYVGFGPNMSVC
ncbi:uncharacterized protein LOC112126206 isoform X3 [Cimex lectularius]|uniref:Uncharacterized protein n=1 Tax=Cimex lectularius TaxID=79782 RepID=A0A8I6TLP8_CIMLE|nr:uncharacterized protein LOC112126206 isoform X3 [Cimex lectularius]